MSGGSLDYICWKVETAAYDIAASATNPLQKAFAKHLELVFTALHDTEWVFSGDYAEGDDAEAIKKVLGKDYKSKVFDVLQTDAIELIKQLEEFTDA